MLEMNLNGRLAIVTGGSQGVGRGIAVKLAEAGADVIIVHYDRTDEQANETMAQIRKQNVQAGSYKLDVTDHEAVSAMVKDIRDTFGHIDILVNNAGISIRGEIDELSYAQIEAVLNVNVMGPFTMCKEVLPIMAEQKFGRIINIASTSMYTGGGGGAHYAASKSALMGMMRNTAKVYGKYNVTSNNLAISLIDTELFRQRYADPKERAAAIAEVPVGRAGTPEDVGNAVCFLASEFADYINGAIIQIDGGRLYA